MFYRLVPVLSVIACEAPCFAGVGSLPNEPIRLDTTPQFFVDDYVVDNRFAIKYKHNAVTRRFHQPEKHPANGGGVVVTRQLLWPGGDLVLNVEAPQGEVKVRVSDAGRTVLPGLDYQDCEPFSGDSTNHTVRWKGQTIEALKGKVIRLEIFLQDADLYTFRATGSE